MTSSFLGTSRLLPWLVAAIVGPSVVLGVAVRALTARADWQATELVARMDSELRGQRVDVLVVGPSIARTDVDAYALGAGLATPPLSVVRLAQPLAAAPIWYAILHERVYAAGISPKLVVVVATL